MSADTFNNFCFTALLLCWLTASTSADEIVVLCLLGGCEVTMVTPHGANYGGNAHG
jgi:hypothetical protein